MAPERTNDPGEVGRPGLCSPLRPKVLDELGPQQGSGPMCMEMGPRVSGED